MHCFGSILLALDDLSSGDENAATVSGARGLTVRLRDFRFIITLFVLKKIFTVAGPVSRQLQGVAVDLAQAAKLIADCRSKFEDMRLHCSRTDDSSWNDLVEEARVFAIEHDIETQIAERQRKKKMMHDEQAVDEAPSGEQRLKVCMFLPILDQICSQLRDRFGCVETKMLEEMSVFAGGNLKRGSTLKADDIAQISEIYGLDRDALVDEFTDFCNAFCTLNNSDVPAVICDIETDLDPDYPSPDLTDDDGQSDEERLGLDEGQRRSSWLRYNFIAPLQACFQLTGYPHLLRLYWILVTLPVTSCSAERALSRLRIIKNRLRSSMCDDWMKALMVIASEKDLLQRISNDNIIDCYAQMSDKLKEQLIFCS
jgi:hypothetical protein